MVLRCHIPKPSECGGDIGFGLVWVITVVVLGCFRLCHARNEPLYPVERVVGLLSLTEPCPRATLLCRSLNGCRAIAWSEPLSGLGQLHRMVVVAIGQHLPGLGLVAPGINFGLTRLLRQTRTSREPTVGRSPLFKINVQCGCDKK